MRVIWAEPLEARQGRGGHDRSLARVADGRPLEGVRSGGECDLTPAHRVLERWAVA